MNPISESFPSAHFFHSTTIEQDRDRRNVFWAKLKYLRSPPPPRRGGGTPEPIGNAPEPD